MSRLKLTASLLNRPGLPATEESFCFSFQKAALFS
jgi:hypothetical protein